MELKGLVHIGIGSYIVQLPHEEYFCLLIYSCLHSFIPHILQSRLLNQSCQNKAV
jgi:hypothetical protein